MEINLTSYDNQINEDEDNKILYIKEDNNEERKIEQMEILKNTGKNKSILSPQEQFKNYPNYTFLKMFGKLCCKIGNTYTFNFDANNNNSPKICIGPHWYLAIVSNILIILFVTCLFYFLAELESPVWQKILYFFLGGCVFYFFNKCALINPGIIQNRKNDFKNNTFCNICQVYYDINNNVEDCDMCGICVENMDHHCIWVGKCVAKNNKFSFYAMLVFIGFIYTYIILLAILNYTSKLGKNSKNN